MASAEIPSQERESNGPGQTCMMDHALDFVARVPSARVFPVRPGAKFPPLIDAWPERASRDPQQIRDWWERWPDANIGSTGTAVLDVDIRDGKLGMDAFKSLGLSNEEKQRALVVRTASGGFHFHYLHPESGPLPSRNGLFPGLDVKADGGYVLAPGSSLANDGGAYALERAPEALGCFPQEVATLVQTGAARRAERAPRDAIAEGAEVDDPDSLLRAVEFLRDEAPEAIEGQGGDQTTYNTLCALRDMGLSAASALGLALEYYNPRCAPPWDPEELETKVENAYAYAQNPVGAKHPQALAVAAAVEFNGVSIEAPARRSLWRWRHGDPIRLDMQWLFFEKLPRAGTALLVGPSGAGKSFLTAHIAERLAKGSELYGTPPDERCGAVVFAAEGVAATPNRLSALGEPGEVLPIWSDAVGNLQSASEKARARAMIAEAGAECLERFGLRLGLIVIDTLAASGLLVDENNNSECAAAVKFLEGLAVEFGCLVLVTHHPPKNGSGARGGSALHAGFDTVLEITHDGGPVRKVDCTKGRDAPTGKWGVFSLIPRTLGIDSRGREVTTCNVSAAVDNGASGVAQLSPEIVEAVLQAVGEERWRDHHKATGCIHEAIGRAMGLDYENRAERAQIERVLRAGLRGQWLKQIEGKTEGRKPARFIVAGEVKPIALPASA